MCALQQVILWNNALCGEVFLGLEQDVGHATGNCVWCLVPVAQQEIYMHPVS